MDFKEIISRNYETLRQDILYNHVKNKQYVTGKTINSLELKFPSDTKAQVLAANYLGVLENGRSGGRVPANFRQILKQWAINKGIIFQNESQLNTFAYFLANKIAREGTKQFRTGVKKDIYTTPINDFAERITNELVEKYITEIDINIIPK